MPKTETWSCCSIWTKVDHRSKITLKDLKLPEENMRENTPSYYTNNDYLFVTLTVQETKAELEK